MTLYYTIVFVLLVVEMALTLFIVAPIPRTIRKGIVNVLENNPLVSQISYGLRFTFVFILVLFIDSVNRVWRVQEELNQARTLPGSSFGDREDFLARKFYAQRNMYLCGFTLFLSFVLNRTYYLVKVSLEVGAPAAAGSNAEVDELKKQLKQKDLELDTLKKQSEGLSREYNRLSDELNAGKAPIDKKNQ